MIAMLNCIKDKITSFLTSSPSPVCLDFLVCLLSNNQECKIWQEMQLLLSLFFQLQTPASFAQSVQELTIALQRTGDPANLNRLRPHLELLANIDPSPGWLSRTINLTYKRHLSTAVLNDCVL